MNPFENLKLEILKTTNSQLVCFFGGSFDPWHLGHTSCVQLHVQYAPMVPLFVLPDFNPYKSNYDFSTEAINKRYAEVADHCPKLQHVHLSRALLESKKLNPTFKWLVPLKKALPHMKFGLLLGADSFQNLTSWKESDQLLKSLSFLEIVPRQEALEERLKSQAQLLTKFQHLSITVLPNHPHEHLSSSELKS